MVFSAVNGCVLGNSCIYSHIDSITYKIELIPLKIRSLSPTINIAYGENLEFSVWLHPPLVYIIYSVWLHPPRALIKFVFFVAWYLRVVYSCNQHVHGYRKLVPGCDDSKFSVTGSCWLCSIITNQHNRYIIHIVIYWHCLRKDGRKQPMLLIIRTHWNIV